MKGQNSKVKTDQYTNKFWLGLGEGERVEFEAAQTHQPMKPS